MSGNIDNLKKLRMPIYKKPLSVRHNSKHKDRDFCHIRTLYERIT